MKKLLIPAIAFMFIAVTANANPRLKNQKHFAKDFDPNVKIEAPVTTLAELSKGPQFKNFGHEVAEQGTYVNVDNANELKGPQYKNQKNFGRNAEIQVQQVKPELAIK